VHSINKLLAYVFKPMGSLIIEKVNRMCVCIHKGGGERERERERVMDKKNVGKQNFNHLRIVSNGNRVLK
jgi:hypothetical protein